MSAKLYVGSVISPLIATLSPLSDTDYLALLPPLPWRAITLCSHRLNRCAFVSASAFDNIGI